MDPMTIMALLSTVGGGLGTIFGSGDSETERLLKERLKGIDPKILEEMRRRTRGALGNQGEAERVSTQQRLGRADAPVAKQEEVMDKIRTRQFGAIGDAMSQVDIMNEEYKRGAMGDLANFTAQKNADRGQGYASLFGAGANFLTQGNQLEQLEKLFSGGGAQFQRRTFMPMIPMMSGGKNYLNNFQSSFGGF